MDSDFLQKCALITGGAPRHSISLDHLPNELILQIAENLDSLQDLNSLLRTSGHYSTQLTPLLLRRAASTVSTPRKRSVFHWAVGHGCLPLVERLLSLPYDNTKDYINNPDKYGTLPLHSAVVGGYEGIVQLLTSNNARIDYPRPRIADAWTPLHCAISFGYHSIARRLLVAGAGPEAKTYAWRQTALFHAIQVGDLDMVRLLLEMGADTHVTDWDNMSVPGSARAADSGIANFLLQSGAVETFSLCVWMVRQKYIHPITMSFEAWCCKRLKVAEYDGCSLCMKACLEVDLA